MEETAFVPGAKTHSKLIKKILKYNNVSFDGNSIIINKKKLKGLTNYLSSELWPRVDSDRIVGGQNPHYAKLRGNLVDREMWEAINTNNFNQLSHSEMTRALFSKIKALGLHPIASQVFIGSEQARIGTAIDIVALDNKGNDVIIEIKTTSASEEQHKARYFKQCNIMPLMANVADVPNCEYWRHQLQVAHVLDILNVEYKLDKMYGIVIVVTRSNTTFDYPVNLDVCHQRMGGQYTIFNKKKNFTVNMPTQHRRVIPKKVTAKRLPQKQKKRKIIKKNRRHGKK